jgi:hypothetical protein
MTNLSKTDPGPFSVKKIVITLLATAIFGSAIAFVALSQFLSTNQATSIVSIGRYDQTYIEEPQAVIERIKAPNFAAAVSARTGIPELSTLLPAAQYGGSGALNARSLRDPNLIEIRINLVQPEWTQKAINAVVDELLADHSAKLAPLVQNIEATLTQLNKNTSEMAQANDAIQKRINGSSQNEEAGRGESLLALALIESGLASLVKSQNDVKGALFTLHRSQVVAAPTMITLKATYRIVAAGALAGFLAGLLLLQMLPGLFRTGRSQLGVTRPDPI